MRVTGEVHSMESLFSLDQFVAYFDSHQAVLLQINWQLTIRVHPSEQQVSGRFS